MYEALRGGADAQGGYGSAKERIYTNKNLVNYATRELNKMRPKSAVSDSYVRRKYTFDDNQKYTGITSGSPATGASGSYGSHAESMIDRVVNYGKDIPHYLLPKGSVRRGQSAGRQRSDGGQGRSDRNKQVFRLCGVFSCG